MDFMNKSPSRQKPPNDKKKKANRNASPSAYGWCFQVGAGISLILDHVRDFTHIKMEGKSDDIELSLGEGKKLYAQAKSVMQIGDQRNAEKNFGNALNVLSEDEQNGDAFKLVYITNIANPLSSKTVSAFQYGHNYDFHFLPTDAKKKIIDKVGTDFPTEKFQLQIINFFGEGKDKFQTIKEKIEEFLRYSIDDKSYSNPLLDNWFTTFMINASDKPDKEKKINLTKKQVIFPVIAVLIDPPITDVEFSRVCDYENYTEIAEEFRKTIYETTCDYEFIAQILGDFIDKRKIAADTANYKYEFTKNEWQNYENEFISIRNVEKRQALIKILLLTIITRNNKINQIKTAVNL
jgi:hypothetical protein